MSEFEGGMPAPTAVDAHKGAMDQYVQQLLARMAQSHLGAPPGAAGQGGQAPAPQPQRQIMEGHPGKSGASVDQWNLGQSAGQDIMRGVQAAVQQHKQKQLNEATAMWMTLQAAHERLTMTNQVNPDGTVDLMKDPMAQAILTDPKKMKNMAKAFQVDMMNPEKTNVYAEGLKRAMKLDKAGKMVKMMRSLKMMKGPQPQMGPEQNQQMGQELGQKIEGMTGPNAVDPKVLGDTLRYRTEEMKQDELNKRLDTRETGLNTRQDKGFEHDDKKTEYNWKQKWDMFKEDEKYKRWRDNLLARTRIQAAKIAGQKPSQALAPIAVFARTGVKQYEKAQALIEKLQGVGLFTSWAQNKLEDAIWGHGTVDPTLPSDVRRDIGELRSAIQLGDSAMLRAHTGRTSKEIYDDIHRMNSLGQDTESLFGALENSVEVLGDYADVLTPETQQDLKTPMYKAAPTPRSGGGKTKLPGKLTKASELP